MVVMMSTQEFSRPLSKTTQASGLARFVSKHGGRPSNRHLSPEYRAHAMASVRERYADFGRMLAAEKLTELHGFDIFPETLWQWMIEDGIWVDRRHGLHSI